jgi:beta-ureidopropionase / N-carbamoyl-L-amino-acid hydrolase
MTFAELWHEPEPLGRDRGTGGYRRYSVRQESYTPVVRFDQRLRDRIAGVLAARVPTAMLFVRNPTRVSHSPAEHADLADCEAGVRALALVPEAPTCP